MDFKKILPIWPDGHKIEEEKTNLRDERDISPKKLIVEDADDENGLVARHQREERKELGMDDELLS